MPKLILLNTAPLLNEAVYKALKALWEAQTSRGRTILRDITNGFVLEMPLWPALVRDAKLSWPEKSPILDPGRR